MKKSVAVVFVAATGTCMLQSVSGPFFFNDEIELENIACCPEPKPKTRDDSAAKIQKRSSSSLKRFRNPTTLLILSSELPSQTCPTERN